MEPFKCDYLQLILPRIIRSLICFMHLALGDRSPLNAASFINLPFRSVTNKESDWIHWQQCKSENSQVLINIFHGDIKEAFMACPKENILIKIAQMQFNGTAEIISTIKETFQWRGVGMSNTLHFVSSVQTNLWKLASAFHPLKTWEGKINIKDDKYTLCFR